MITITSKDNTIIANIQFPLVMDWRKQKKLWKRQRAPRIPSGNTPYSKCRYNGSNKALHTMSRLR